MSKTNPLRVRRTIAAWIFVGLAVALVAGPAFAGDGDNVGGFKFKIYGEEESGYQKPPGDLAGNGNSSVVAKEQVMAPVGTPGGLDPLIGFRHHVDVWFNRIFSMRRF